MIDGNSFRQRALALVAAGDASVASRLAAEFGISRQACSRRLAAMVAAGAITEEGATRGKVYQLRTLREHHVSYPRHGLTEDQVWLEQIAPELKDLPDNVQRIWDYTVTEMVNNAIDHSAGSLVSVGFRRNVVFTEVWVGDDGVGIFKKIQQELGLYDPRGSLLELAKGKLTTDPRSHTGEGIFFSSKALDGFCILSSGLSFEHGEGKPDTLIELRAAESGTLVFMRLANDSGRRLEDIFSEFQNPEDLTFDRTVVPVRLVRYEGERLVSRSQAKRLTQRFDRFRSVVLDFDQVKDIGPAFADELFRVFAGAHPAITLTTINTSPGVEATIRRAKATRPQPLPATTDQKPR